jgi:hypothetical protein
MNFKKVEFEEKETILNLPQSVFTYEVNMIVSVFAEDETKARLDLDQNGGFVSHRTVELKDALELYRPED